MDCGPYKGVERSVEGDQAEMTTDRDQEIRNRAYYLWEKAGRPAGHEHDFWAQAAREIEGDPAERAPAEDENRFIAR